MADHRRCDGMRQQPFPSAQERVFDGGGGGSSRGPAFGNDFDHGSYMALLGAGIISPSTPWAVDEATVAPAMNSTQMFPVGNYVPSYQQPNSLVAPIASSLHAYTHLHTSEPTQQWPPQASSSSVQGPTFTVHTTLGGYSQPAAQAAVEQPAKDGYNWRKYGQKQLKHAESPRSYYKCTQEGCPVKKTVERSSDGCIKEITYKGRHSHPRPLGPGRHGHAGVACGEDDIIVEDVGAEDKEEPGDEDALHEDDTETNHGRVVKKSKIIIQTRSEVDLLDDGFRWRKYGQKVVKGNPRPRSYYKCTTDECNVRKQIERASDDPNFVLTTYTGRHNHDPPGRNETTTATYMLQPPDAPNINSSFVANQMPVTMNPDDGIRLLKQENRE